MLRPELARAALVGLALRLASGCGAAEHDLLFPPEGAGEVQELAALGDLDGDGRADSLIGSPRDDREVEGGGSVRWVSGADGTVLLERFGEGPDEQLGLLVAGAGDVDGDGRTDALVAGRPADRERARIEVLSSSDASVLLSFEVAWPADAREAAFAAPAGDLDADGTNDFVALDVIPDPEIPFPTGRLLLVSGKDSGRVRVIDATARGLSLRPPVGSAGDVNADGRADVFARTAAHGAVIFSGLDKRELLRWEAPTRAICSMGDVDGDRCADLALAGFEDDDDSGGAAEEVIRILSGRTGEVLRVLHDDRQGLFTDLGASLVLAGDLDGDGVPDLAAGAPTHDDGENDERYGCLLLFSGRTGEVLGSALGPARLTYLGWDVAVLGDLDGDGASAIAASGWVEGDRGDERAAWFVFRSAALLRSRQR